MIRFIGAVLITLGTAAWGLMGVYRLRSRVNSLHALTSALGLMKSEICDRLTPMPELLARLADTAAYPANLMFKNAAEQTAFIGSKPFSSIWSQAVANTPELMLKAPEELVLTDLGIRLGRYDLTEQAAAIGFAQHRLEDYIRRAELERDSNSKVHAFLGIAAGLFAVIILL